MRLTLPEFLKKYGACVEQTGDITYSLSLVNRDDSDEVCRQIPLDDVFDEVTFVGDSFSDRGLSSFFEHDRRCIRELVIRRSAVTGYGVHAFHGSVGIRRLILEVDSQIAEACAAIGTFTSLESLGLHCNRQAVDGELLALSPLCCLSRFDLVARSIGDGICVLRSMPQLMALYLEADEVTDRHLRNLSSARRLHTLGLKCPNATTLHKAHDVAFSELRSLWLFDCAVAADDLKCFRNSPLLERMQLHNIPLTPSLIEAIGTLPIKKLELSGYAGYDGDVLEALKSLSGTDLWM